MYTTLKYLVLLLIVSLLLAHLLQQEQTAQADHLLPFDDPILAPLSLTDSGKVGFWGGAIAMDGNTLAIGADATEISSEDDNADFYGAVYIYTFDEADAAANETGWTQRAKLIPNNVEDNRQASSFGHAVAINGATVVVGESRNTLDGYRGGVYVYTRSGSEWSFQARLALPDMADDELLAGHSVAILGNTIAVGIPDSSGGQNESTGEVHLFERTGETWAWTTTLSVIDDDSHDLFGSAVALQPDRLVVGDPHGATGFPTTRGAIYLYTKGQSGWQFEAKLDSPQSDPSGAMGGAVALEGDVIVAGAEGEDSGDNILQGAIHIFVRYQVSGGDQASDNVYEWRHVYRFTAPDGAEFDKFGHSVSIKDRFIVAGAYQADIDGVENRGAAYVFAPVAGAWVNVMKLTAADGAEDDVLGSAVANNGEWVAVGAPHLNGIGSDSSGRTYVIQVSEFPEGYGLFLPLVRN